MRQQPGSSRNNVLSSLLLLLVTAVPRATPLLGSKPPLTSSTSRPAAVIVPGFLSGATRPFQEMASELRARGVDAVVAPISWWHWLPLLGGRSVRPILERILFAMDHCACDGEGTLVAPWPAYTPADLLADFRHNPGGLLAVGGSTDPAHFPDFVPRGDDFGRSQSDERRSDDDGGRRVFLIGHSASGWISRILVSERRYAGPAYALAPRVAGLVTLGTPHVSAEGVALANVAFAAAEAAPVPAIAVAAGGTTPMDGGDFARQSYELCSASASASTPAAETAATAESGAGALTVDGDGVTPVASAVAFSGAESMVLSTPALHAPDFPRWLAPELARKQEQGVPWYGSPEIIDEWVPWLLEKHGESESAGAV